MQCDDATSDDLDPILGYMRTLYDQHGLDFDRRTASTVLLTMMDDPSSGWILVERDDDEVVGYAVVTFALSVEFGGRWALVDELFIAPERRSEGAGSALMAEIENRCRSLKIQTIQLMVAPHNDGATRLYQRLGFIKRDLDLMVKGIPDA